MAFISPALILEPQQVTELPSLPVCLREPSSGMGNCLRPVNSFTNDNSSHLSFEDGPLVDLNYSNYENYDYSEMDEMDAAAPCHSCNLLDESSLPFYVLASVLGILASAAVLFALLRPLFHRQLCPGRQLFLTQLAVGSALFSIVVPILAPGLWGAHNTYLCHLAHLVWNGSAFAQALLIGCHACLGPKLGAGQVPRLILGLTGGLWGLAILLALPITLASDTSNGLCSLASSQVVLKLLHAANGFAIFVLLPLGLLGAKGLKRALGRGPCPWVDVLWLWFIFWWPRGVLWGLDSLVRSRVLVLSSCPAQQALDLLLPLAEILAILHCVAGPLLLAFFCLRATRTAVPSLPLPARQSSPPDAPGGKS
ncbi:atypical chemokine receptor 1 isoform X2 [Eptesicus fuscus]|uniref:atypical chemokine receptor 1 isoform X2 n=1 Tax=Eptesicus fuscus TaxID=29078 RepID=UPI00240480AC|nr:atypical chemokine receptor 1 isoform X2 [Eptesicus fuscus]